jgi:hypothetical protein
LTLTTLVHADPTTTLPIILGIVTMANVESSRWFMTEEEVEREKKVEQWSAEKRAQGHTIVQPKKHIQSALRLLSVGRILLGAVVPGVCLSSSSPDCLLIFLGLGNCAVLGYVCHFWFGPNLDV